MQSTKEILLDLLHTVRLMKYDWEDLNWDDIDQLKDYYEANMAEGYLSKDEKEFGRALFNEIETLREENQKHEQVHKNMQKVVADLVHDKVNV